MVSLAAFLVYSFYIWRLWILSRNIILCIILAVFATAALISSMVFTIRGIVTKMAISQFYGPNNMLAVLVGIGAATDFLVAFSLSWYLYKSRTGVKESESIVHILIAYTINTGLLASICTLCSLITTVLLPRKSVGLLLSFMVPPLQINGYLGSLNGRQFFRRWGEAHAQSKSEAITMSSLRIASHMPSNPLYLGPTTVDIRETGLEDTTTNPHTCKLSSMMHSETENQFASNIGIAI